eukprot:PhF_6_TR10064/c0_g1_i1/m.15576
MAPTGFGVFMVLTALLILSRGVHSQVIFEVTTGGYSWYKVKIVSTTLTETYITNSAVSQTCTNNGLAAYTPCPNAAINCPSSDPFRLYYSGKSCRSAFDPTCIRYSTTGVANDVTTITGRARGGLFINMDPGTPNGEACGNQFFYSTGCAPGLQFSTDGTKWPDPCTATSSGIDWCGTALNNYNCDSATANCATANTVPVLENYALCVSKATCKCINGDCDVTGDCKLGSCKRGWWGVLCNEICDSTFCLGRNDVAMADQGYRTTSSNLCECTCSSDFTPSGTGPAGTRCASCTTVGSLKCQASKATLLGTSSATPSPRKQEQFAIQVEARFLTNQLVDTTVFEAVTAGFSPAGTDGATAPYIGYGGALTVYNSEQKLNQGKVVFVLSLSQPCRACIITFASSALTSLVVGPFKVATVGTKFIATRTSSIIARGAPMYLEVCLVDSAGFKDLYTFTTTTTVSLQTTPPGGNGNGGTLGYNTPTTSFTQTITPTQECVASWYVTFTRACTACVLQVSAPGMQTLSVAPVTVTTTATKLYVNTANLRTTISKQESFDVLVQAVDDNGDVDITKETDISVSLLPNGGNGNGGDLLNSANTASLTQRLVKGQILFTLSFTRSCTKCKIQVSDVTGALSAIFLPDIRVTTNVRKFMITSTIPTEVKIGAIIPFVVKAVDENSNVDESYVGRVTPSIQPNGGNGNGGDLTISPAGDITQPFVAGVYTFNLYFTKSCAKCLVDFAEVSNTVIQKATTTAILVTSDRVRLTLKRPLPSLVMRGDVTEIAVQSLDTDGNVDVKDTSSLTLRLLPNGGNGDGGVLSDISGALQKSLVAGEISFRVSFSKACTLCVLQLIHELPAIPLLNLTGIEVRTRATRYIISTKPPTTIAKKTPFRVALTAVDENGNIDVTEQSLVTISIKPNGGNGNGGDLRSDGSLNSLSKLLVNGANVWNPEFSKACDACVLVLSSTTKSTESDPIFVTTTATKLASTTPWTALSVTTVTPYVATFPVNTQYSLDVRAVDDDGSVDTLSKVAVTLQLLPNGGNGNGEPLTNIPTGLTQSLVNGKVTFQLTNGKACDACVLNVITTALNGVTFPAIRISATGKKIINGKTWPAKVAKNTPVDVLFQIVDEAGSIDRTWNNQLSVVKLANGGNGDGGELKNLLSGNSLTQVASNGEVTMRFSFTKACTACLVRVSDSTGTLAPFTLPAIQVTTTTEKLLTQVTSTDTTQKNIPFVFQVRAVDSDGNVNTDDTSGVLMRVYDQATNTDAVTTLTGGKSMLQNLVAGVAQYTVTINSVCTKCSVSTTYYGAGNNALTSVTPALISLPNYIATDSPPVTAAPTVQPTPAPVQTVIVVPITPSPTPAPPGSTPSPPGPVQTVILTLPPNPTPAPPTTTPVPPTPVPPTLSVAPTTASTPSPATTTSTLDNTTLMYIGIAAGAFVFLLIIACVIGCCMMNKSSTPKQQPAPVIITAGGNGGYTQSNPITGTFNH